MTTIPTTPAPAMPAIVERALDRLEAVADQRARRRRRDAYLDVLTANMHTGSVIHDGGLKWLLDELPGIDLVLLQEVSHPRGRTAARRLLPRSRWHMTGPEDGQEGGTFVYARRARFRRIGHVNRLITPGRKADPMHPARRLNGLELVDRVTGRTVRATSAHTWHIVGRDLEDRGNPVVAGHVEQTRAYAAHHAPTPTTEDRLDVTGGDWNEDLDGPIQASGRSVRSILERAAALVPTYRLAPGGNDVRLDDVFVRPAKWLDVVRRRVLTIPVRSADHPAIVVRLKVEALP